MRLGSEFEHVDLSVAEIHPAVPGVYPGGDVHVVARVRAGEFSGAVDAWVLPDGWSVFLRQLGRLDRERAGDATLEGISPGELRLRLFAVDRAGHLAIEGAMSILAGPRGGTSVTFAAIEFDPTLLVPLLRELTTASRVEGG